MMHAIPSGTRKATRFRQDPGRPRVPDIVEDQRNTTIMHDIPHVRIPGQRLPEPQHKPWCADHIDDTCMSADLAAPGQIVALTWQPGDVVRVTISTGHGTEVVTLDELEQRSLAMLATALIGRGVSPSPNVLAAVTS